MYDLSRLGNDRFEHMVQALSIGLLGPGVTIFGAGPDGGREATFNGQSPANHSAIAASWPRSSSG